MKRNLIKLMIHHLLNNIRRVREFIGMPLDNAAETVDFNSAYKTLLQAEDNLIDLNDHYGRLQKARQAAANTPQTPMTINTTKYLDIGVPKFDGTPSNYHQFKSAFNIVTSRKQATREERMIFLSQHLDEKPAKKIENIPFTEEGYHTAWGLLNEAYVSVTTFLIN